MSENRLQRVEDIFHQAAELSPHARSAFLDKACGADRSLRREVESLLEHESENGNTFAGLVRDDAPESIAHYRISGKLGQGGMGAVYRATDTKLGREVAIKVLPDSFAEDADRIARFTREAKVLASLNHPNIAQIYGVEERALVMELVPGATLKGPLPLKIALNYARQIAEALEAAHEKGIVHRDLKPANIVVTPEGIVKLLDFGLAAVAPSAIGDPLSSPTITMQTAQSGVIMGTAAYMSPEQAAGKPVDKRADVWSFGVVLWESLTGHRLFEGDTQTQTLAEVLRGPIDFDKLPRETPTKIHGLLKRCLERNVKNRLRDIGEARIAIEATLTGEATLEAKPAPASRRLWLAWSITTVATAGLAVIAFLHFRERPAAPAALVHFEIPSPENATLGFNLSPDGRKLAFMAGRRLWVHSLETGESRDLTDTDHGPFWSADSRFIAYGFQGKLKKIAATGGAPQTITDQPGIWGNGDWNQDDVIIFAERQVGIFRVPASGGVPVQITALDPALHENAEFSPSFLPDGRHFVYIRASTEQGKSAIYLGSLDARAEQQGTKPLAAANSQPMYAASVDPSTGFLLFVREGNLMAQPFDNRRLELTGQATPVAEQVVDTPFTRYVAFSVSANGVLAYQRSSESSGELTWYDRQGKAMGTVAEPGNFGDLALSPDGTQLALTKNRGADLTNIWLLDLSRGGAGTRFTFSAARDTDPVWSPEGSSIIYSSKREGSYNLYQKATNGATDEVVLLKSDEDKRVTSWSRDGRLLLYTVVHPKEKSDIWVLPLKGQRKPLPFPRTEFNERDARFSPDGRWVAYTSNESGQDEVYVRSFSVNTPGTAVEVGGKWPISNGYGVDPRWRADGRELYYQSLRGGLLTVEIATKPTFRAGPAQPLGDLNFSSGSRDLFLVWDSAADGSRFLRRTNKSGSQPYTVVLNWQARLKK